MEYGKDSSFSSFSFPLKGHVQQTKGIVQVYKWNFVEGLRTPSLLRNIVTRSIGGVSLPVPVCQNMKVPFSASKRMVKMKDPCD